MMGEPFWITRLRANYPLNSFIIFFRARGYEPNESWTQIIKWFLESFLLRLKFWSFLRFSPFHSLKSAKYVKYHNMWLAGLAEYITQTDVKR